jgi:dehydrogenase
MTARGVGDRVGVPWVQYTCGRCEWCSRSKPIFCEQAVGTSVQIAGGHAEYMLAYADATMRLPEVLSYEQAAPIFCAGYTVWSGLRWAQPQPRERLAVIGIGGLGHLAIQYAKAAGFITIAISRSTDKDKMIRELGADEIVRDGKGLAAAGGADVILGTSNSVDAMADSIAGLRPDGRLVLMGLENKPLPIHPGDLIMRRIRILGSQQNSREYLYEALQIAATGKVKVITERYALDEIATACERVEQGKVRFRAVITMGD